MQASQFLNKALERNYTFYTGTPCSYLKPFINYAIDSDQIDFYDATNEGDAVAMAAGAWLAGKKSVVMFQNSGLGNAVNPLTSLSYTFKVPVLGITTLRGEPGGPADEPQHELMGQITGEMLTLMQIPWRYFPTNDQEIDEALAEADRYIMEERKSFFLVMKKGDIDNYELTSKIKNERMGEQKIETKYANGDLVTRTDALREISNVVNKKQPVIATTGKTGRELFEVADLENQLYMVGSMGCAVTLGLGMSLVRNDLTPVVIDGDGALMMRMGGMASVGRWRPSNLVHILLDNGAHDSTGGQSTGSEAIDFIKIAEGTGYKNIFGTDNLNDLKKYLSEKIGDNDGPTFVHFKMKLGSPKTLGRPTVTPEQVATRFKKYFNR
jgi:phosphonopyruvate decarboxylase